MRCKSSLSYGFWQREYGGRADVLGKTIALDRHPAEIVGISEPGFDGTEVSSLSRHNGPTVRHHGNR